MMKNTKQRSAVRKMKYETKIIIEDDWLIKVKEGNRIIGAKKFHKCPTKDELSNYIEECKK